MALSVWSGIDHICHTFFCVDSANGTNLCNAAHLCNAMCGFCAREPEGMLTLAQNSSIEVTTADSTNNPRYRTLAATAGQIYRVRAFPDMDAVPAAARSLLLIIRNPAGKTIRRAYSNTGNPIRASDDWMERTPAELEAEMHDAEMGCAGATHLDILFQAAEDGIYSIGLAQMTNTDMSRGNMSIHEFTLQWRGKLHMFNDEDHAMFDFGQPGTFALLGPPANGTLTLRVDDVTTTLAPLSCRPVTKRAALRAPARPVPVPVPAPTRRPKAWP